MNPNKPSSSSALTPIQRRLEILEQENTTIEKAKLILQLNHLILQFLKNKGIMMPFGSVAFYPRNGNPTIILASSAYLSIIRPYFIEIMIFLSTKQAFSKLCGVLSQQDITQKVQLGTIRGVVSPALLEMATASKPTVVPQFRSRVIDVSVVQSIEASLSQISCTGLRGAMQKLAQTLNTKVKR